MSYSTGRIGDSSRKDLVACGFPEYIRSGVSNSTWIGTSSFISSLSSRVRSIISDDLLAGGAFVSLTFSAGSSRLQTLNFLLYGGFVQSTNGEGGDGACFLSVFLVFSVLRFFGMMVCLLNDA